MFVHKVGMCFSDTQRNPLKNNFSGNVFSQGGNGPLKHKGILSLSKQRQIFSAHLVTRWEQALTTQRKPLKKKVSQGTHLFRMREQPFKTQRNPLNFFFSGHMFVQNVGTGL